MNRALQLTLLLAPLGCSAQQMQLVSGTVHIANGTTVRIADGISWQIASASLVVNDGIIDLGSTAIINEAPGSPIAGSGMEVIAAQPGANQPVSGHGGLGLVFSQGAALPSLTISRAHLPRNDANLGNGIARWYSVAGLSGLSPNATVALRYDDTEINGLDETLLTLSHSTDPSGPWAVAPSTIDVDLNEAVGPADAQFDHLTLFAFDPMRIESAKPVAALLSVTPNIVDDMALVRFPFGEALATLKVIDASGRVALAIPAQGQASSVEVDFSGLNAGVYTIATPDGRTARFVKR